MLTTIMKKLLAVSIFLLLQTQIFAQAAENEAQGFHKMETRSFIVEVSATLDKTFLRQCAESVNRAEAFFSKIFKMPAGILTGNFNDNSAAFSKFKDRLRSNSRYSGQIPKNLYEEWFKLAGKIHYRIWDKRKNFGDEWFDFTKVPPEKRESQGLPGAYFAWGRGFGETKDGQELGRRVIRSFVGNREPKSVIASLYHEIGHLYLTSYLMSFGDLPPAWLNEGFAELFAYGLPSDAKTKRKKLQNQAILYELVQTGEYWKFDSFLKIDNAHNLKLVADKSAKSEIIYSQAWSLVDFLTSSPTYSSKFLNFLETMRFSHFDNNLLQGGKKQNFFEMQGPAFKEAFRTEIMDLEQYWVKYVNVKYKQMLTRNPELNYYIGDFYLRRNDLDKAALFFGIAAEKAPDNIESHLGLGRLAFQKQKFEEAMDHFQNAVNADKKEENDDALTWLGYAAIRNEKIDIANTSFAKALEIDAENEEALYGYGISSLKSGEYQRSQDQFEKAYQKSANPQYLLGQGKALFMLKEYTSSRRIFSALSTKWNNPEIPFWLGACSAHLKEKDYALEQLKIAANSANRYANFAKAYIKAITDGTEFPKITP